MSILNQGRNEIRFNNSDGRCLLENWVEEVNIGEIINLERHNNIFIEYY